MENKGFKILGENKSSFPNRQYLVVGVERGGTSAIASALNAIGLPLTEGSISPNYEDKHLSNLLDRKDWRGLLEKISLYDKKYGSFYWKLPRSSLHLNRLSKIFPNPYFIFVYRDLFAIASRKNMIFDENIFDSIDGSLKSYERILNFSKKTNYPSLHVSYEKMLINKDVFSVKLAEFCNIVATNEIIGNISSNIGSSPKKYLVWAEATRQQINLKKYNYDGYIDVINRNVISGWMVDKNKNKALEVELLVNNEVLTEIRCKIERQDVIDAGKSI